MILHLILTQGETKFDFLGEWIHFIAAMTNQQKISNNLIDLPQYDNT